MQDGEGRESAALMAAGYIENGGGLHLAVRDIIVPGEGDYESRTGACLRMRAEFFSRVLARADADGVTAIQSRTHPFPGDGPACSPADYEGESESAGTIKRCLGDVPMGSLLFSREEAIGRVWTADGRNEPLHQLGVAGRGLLLRPLAHQEAEEAAVNASLYDRQIRAFGEEGQRALSRVRVGVAGAGGIGSAVAEQLARAGVKHFTILDSDEFEPSNMARMCGTDAGTRRGPKADVVAGNVRRIAPDAEVAAGRADICSQEALALLKECDIVFGCVDREAPRRALNDFAYRFFVPVVDAGMGIDAGDGGIAGGAAGASIAAPSLPCLRCSGIVGSGGRREGRGGRGCGRPVPSVVPLTTMAASLAVLLFKDMLIGFAEPDSCMLTFDLRTLSANTMSPTAVHGCVCMSVAGMGDCAAAPAPRGECRQRGCHAGAPPQRRRARWWRRAAERVWARDAASLRAAGRGSAPNIRATWDSDRYSLGETAKLAIEAENDGDTEILVRMVNVHFRRHSASRDTKQLCSVPICPGNTEAIKTWNVRPGPWATRTGALLRADASYMLAGVKPSKGGRRATGGDLPLRAPPTSTAHSAPPVGGGRRGATCRYPCASTTRTPTACAQ